MKETDVDVLVVGAGPAGLMCALGLAKANVKVRIIDDKPDKIFTGHADGISPRTIEVLQSYGLADRLIKEGNQMIMAFTNRVPCITTPTARYPFEITLHQGAIEALFLDAMKEMNLEVSRCVIPTSFKILEDRTESSSLQCVQVCLKHLDMDTSEDSHKSDEIVYTKYLIGADGAHSWVRKFCGIAMEGEQTDDVWGVIDMIPDTDFPDIRNKAVIQSDTGSCINVPREGDMTRLYIQLEVKNSGNFMDIKSGRIDRNRSGIGPSELLDIARRAFHPYTFKTPKAFDWWTIYSVGQRVAASYSIKERIFIVGDACHTHSPKAGQGMNASINDAYNLVWKLVYVLRGWGQEGLLKTYELERRSYALELIEFDKKWAKMFSTKQKIQNSLNGEAVDDLAHKELLRAFQEFGGLTSGIGIQYPGSTIIDHFCPQDALHLAIGQRIPPVYVLRAADARIFQLQDLLPSDTRFKMLVFCGDISEEQKLSDLGRLAEKLLTQGGLLNKYSPGKGFDTVFDFITIMSGKKERVMCNNVPVFFRTPWVKLFIDDKDSTGDVGGKAYSSFGIDPSKGAIVIVRPDGYVGTITPLDGVAHLDRYFSGFMQQC
ncbi:hypothetical protein VKT23_011883 [Stygiomarasmius scandens]|uniref:Uncharacterized protein n=1 Tax=Marasmiellus scandens TaxID=2682957 RepID=A0ABR1J9S9_9AGAR